MILDNKVILITGGTGSMGKVLVRRILSGECGTPRKIIVMSRDEAKQHEMRISYLHKNKTVTDEIIYRNFMNVLEFRIGDVRNYCDLCSAMRDSDIVINAAALKQVPTCEYFPFQALLTNCQGAENIVRVLRENSFGVQSVLGISTDKAVKPVNAMGMTKALMERILLSGNILVPKTRFICVRYGNVLASRGSVIPLFHDQIKNGGPVTLTVPTMTRFLLTLNQAVDTVFAALKSALPGEIFVPNAKSATVENIAKVLIGNRPIEIKITGIRPGEKMHEIMVSDEEAPYTEKRGDFYAVKSMLPELTDLNKINSAGFTQEFSSGNTVMNLPQTEELLRNNLLLLEQVDSNTEGELLR